MQTSTPLLAQIQAAFPTLSIREVDTNHDGLINDVVIINRELVFRFPKDDAARRDQARELKILQLVRPYLTLPVPVVEWESDDFIMYRLLPGQGLHRHTLLRLDTCDQTQVIEQLGKFLHQLHTIPRHAIEEAGIGTAGSVRTREDWLRLYAEAQRDLYPLLMGHAREWVDHLFTPIVAGTLDLEVTPKLVHGDLGPYHILFDPTRARLSGVIDFGTGGMGDPADDLAGIINGLGESILQHMAPAYPELEAALDRARFWAGTLEVQWALGGVRTGDLSWFTVPMGRARDVWPIGAKINL